LKKIDFVSQVYALLIENYWIPDREASKQPSRICPVRLRSVLKSFATRDGFFVKWVKRPQRRCYINKRLNPSTSSGQEYSKTIENIQKRSKTI
jgi:hypothetical protein